MAHDHDLANPEELDGEFERRRDAATEAHVGDVACTSVLRDIVDAGDDARVAARPTTIENADRDHRSAGGDAALAVKDEALAITSTGSDPYLAAPLPALPDVAATASIP